MYLLYGNTQLTNQIPSLEVTKSKMVRCVAFPEVTPLNTPSLFLSLSPPSLTDKMSLPNPSVLLQWANTHIHVYGIRVNDLTTSWSDGLALCALIHGFHPELMLVSAFLFTLFVLKLSKLAT